MASTFYSRPSSSCGYWRGVGSEGPQSQGQGSGYGPAQQGIGLFPQGSGPAQAGGGAWSPTVTYMLIFVVAEIIAFGILARVLR